MSKPNDSSPRGVWGRGTSLPHRGGPSFIISTTDGTGSSIFDVEAPSSNDGPSDGNNNDSLQSLYEYITTLTQTVRTTAAGLA